MFPRRAEAERRRTPFQWSCKRLSCARGGDRNCPFPRSRSSRQARFCRPLSLPPSMRAVTVAKLHKGKDQRDQTVHQVFHWTAHPVKIDGCPENPDVRFPELRIKALHVVLVDAGARFLKPAVKISGAGPDLELPCVVKLHLSTPSPIPLIKGLRIRDVLAFSAFGLQLNASTFMFPSPAFTVQ